jgi:adenosine deaminase
VTRDLTALPKAHLHVHLEATWRPRTLASVAEGHGLPTPRMTGWADFAEFDRMYQAAAGVLRTADDVARLVGEMAEDAAAAGCRWVEPAVWLPLHRDRLGPPDAVLELLTDAARAATERTGVGIGFLVAADRVRPVEEAVEQARVAARWAGRGVVAFGLHNQELGFPPEPFAEAFRIAREAGLLSAPHGGELAGPEWVAGSLDALGADRVQHGIRAIEDPALVERLVERGTVLDVCPTSNLVLDIVPSLEEHPLPRLLEAGVTCSLNGDDPIMFDCDLASEYELARSGLGLADEQLAALAAGSIRGSGAPQELKDAALADVAAWLAAAP